MSIVRRISLALLIVAVLAVAGTLPLAAQQTLGGIVGTVTDPAGSVVPGVTVTAVNQGTKLTRTATSNAEGSYALADLPIGQWTLTFKRDGFASVKVPTINVQADRTVTLPEKLTIGEVSTAVTVDANPLLNATDTTNGYVLEKGQIENIPQPTGSFTGLAILSPGVNVELPPGTDAQAGLGNLPIWANGQRDTSNSFSLNGVDSSNLFNGKSTSEVDSARVINSTGATGSGAGGIINSAASVYLSIGNAIPTPAPDTVQEVKVNTSMYDASQGSTSGAHIDLQTASGTNALHGTLSGRRGTDWINASPFFFKNDDLIPQTERVPQLHRYQLGGSLGGPIIKDKLFFFVGYQHLHVSDQQTGDTFLNVPQGLSDANRSAGAFSALMDTGYGTALTTPGSGFNLDSTVLALFNSPSLAGEPGKWLIPNDTGSSKMNGTHPYDAFLPGTSRFTADQMVVDVDYNATPKDTLSVKYFYQTDPTASPYGISSVPGFTEHLDSGAQVFSIGNTYLIKPNLSTQETLGYSREHIYETNEQAFTPQSIPGGSVAPGSINEFGSTYFPGVSIYSVLNPSAYDAGCPNNCVSSRGILNIGPNAEGQSSNTGVYQNRLQPSASAEWTLGKHTVQFGGSYSYTQLNTIDHRPGTGTVAADDMGAFAEGFVTPGSGSTGFYVTSFLQGDASRYFRANQVGMYLQDKFQITPTLTITAGIRYDWDGGLTEKYGRIFNFDPNTYSYSSASDTIVNPGFIIAGNNANGTAGVSPTTLTGRQWGMAPRLAAAWQPEMFHNKVVVRSGFGMYYDRGELFSYFSPGYAIGTVTGGPFGANQQLPFVTAQSCPSQSLYSYYIPTCGGAGGFNPPVRSPTATEGNVENPYGTVRSAAPNNPKASDLVNYLPNIAAINDGVTPISLGVYDRKNTLPYTYNYTFDVQWQPRSDLAIELGYVGNLGRHQVIPVPFNQPGIASPSSPIHGQKYSYGYTVEGPNPCGYPNPDCEPINLPDGTPYLIDAEGGNVDHRVPYIGYAAESISYKSAGIDAYNALTAHIDKRMSHFVQVSASYTYSHALDEQSGLGLFYNGNNPLNLRSGYGSADFDRTHVLNFSYNFQLPEIIHDHSVASYFANGWSLVGLTILQSGQPYSIIDYSGAVGSVYYSTYNGITNPIVPLAPGCTPKNAKTGKSGAFGDAALRSECFTVPVLAAGSSGGGIPSNDPFETGFTNGQRNIFRQAFQKRADASLVKLTKFSDRYTLKYTFDVFNLTNSSSFDIPGNEVSQNEDYNQFPVTGTPPADFYNAPAGLGVVTHTIGSPRQIQMSLALTF